METPENTAAPVAPKPVVAAPPTSIPPVPGAPRASWMMPAVGALLLVLVVGGGLAAFFFMKAPAPAASTEKLVRIGLSLDSLKIQRWGDERDIMMQKAATLGATVTTLSAEGDDATQIAQIENFISQKMDVIVVVAHDGAAVAPIIAKAQAAGIKVIDYDRMTSNGAPDLYLSFDSVKVGSYAAQYVIDAVEKQTTGVANIAFVGGSTSDNNAFLVKEGAMSVLEPLVKAGKIKIVYNEFTKDWSPSEAYSNFKKFLDGGGKVDGVVTSYDGLGYGVIQALAEHKLDGKVPVSGQDAELAAIQRILLGTQTVTIYKPGRRLAEKAVEAAVDFANGRAPDTNAKVNNKTADVTSYLFDSIPVTKENIDEAV
ncbi:MAG: substrate-binding domain-containing protein, partial [Patescibacteria group bacterium]